MCAATKRDSLLAAAKTHFDAFEAHKKLCWRARALSRAQRALLYALDELEMSTMRLQLRAPGERVKPEEALYKLHHAEVPVKNAVSFAQLRLSDCQQWFSVCSARRPTGDMHGWVCHASRCSKNATVTT